MIRKMISREDYIQSVAKNPEILAEILKDRDLWDDSIYTELVFTAFLSGASFPLETMIETMEIRLLDLEAGVRAAILVAEGKYPPIPEIFKDYSEDEYPADVYNMIQLLYYYSYDFQLVLEMTGQELCPAARVRLDRLNALVLANPKAFQSYAGDLYAGHPWNSIFIGEVSL